MSGKEVANGESPSETSAISLDVRRKPKLPLLRDASSGRLAGVQRRKPPEGRKSITHKFSVRGHEGYLMVGMYAEGASGEMFIKMAKEVSTLSGFMDGLAPSISIGLQNGVPLKALVDKLSDTHSNRVTLARIPRSVAPAPCSTMLRGGSAANSSHQRKFTVATDVQVYFCDPQKVPGSVERTRTRIC